MDDWNSENSDSSDVGHVVEEKDVVERWDLL